MSEKTTTYVHKFDVPFEYEGTEYSEISFDYGKLTGRDILAVESELESEGKNVLVPEWSSAYKCKLAALAAGLPSDMFPLMKLRDFRLICGKANAFLLHGGF